MTRKIFGKIIKTFAKIGKFFNYVLNLQNSIEISKNF